MQLWYSYVASYTFICVVKIICFRQGSRNHGGEGAQAHQHFNWGPCPCNVEAWQLLIKLANDELTHNIMTNKEMCKFTISFIKCDFAPLDLSRMCIILENC